MASELGVQTIQHTNGTDALTIDSSGRVAQPQLPAACFHYQGSDLTGAAAVPLNTQSVLQGGMSMSSNVITVPIAGLYKIGFYHLAASTSAYSVLFVRINGQTQGMPHSNQIQFRPPHGNDSFAFQTIASLSANDTVDFFVSSGTIHGNADYNSMFVYLLG